MRGWMDMLNYGIFHSVSHLLLKDTRVTRWHMLPRVLHLCSRSGRIQDLNDGRHVKAIAAPLTLASLQPP